MSVVAVWWVDDELCLEESYSGRTHLFSNPRGHFANESHLFKFNRWGISLILCQLVSWSCMYRYTYTFFRKHKCLHTQDNRRNWELSKCKHPTLGCDLAQWLGEGCLLSLARRSSHDTQYFCISEPRSMTVKLWNWMPFAENDPIKMMTGNAAHISGVNRLPITR